MPQEIVREPARQMLAVALQAEVSAFIDAHAEEVDENRCGPQRSSQRTRGDPAGLVPVRAPRVNDKRPIRPLGTWKRFATTGMHGLTWLPLIGAQILVVLLAQPSSDKTRLVPPT